MCNGSHPARLDYHFHAFDICAHAEAAPIAVESAYAFRDHEPPYFEIAAKK